MRLFAVLFEVVFDMSRHRWLELCPQNPDIFFSAAVFLSAPLAPPRRTGYNRGHIRATCADLRNARGFGNVVLRQFSHRCAVIPPLRFIHFCCEPRCSQN